MLEESAVGNPLLQNNFLLNLQKENTQISIFLVNGIKLQGQLNSFDDKVVVLKNNAAQLQLIYKHAISTIVSGNGNGHKNLASAESNKETSTAR